MAGRAGALALTLLAFGRLAWADTASSGLAAPEFAYVHQISALGAAGPQLLLVGMVVNGKPVKQDIALMPASGDRGAAVALQQVAGAIGIGLESRPDGAIALITPIGTATLAARDVQRRGDVVYVPVELLGEKLGSRIRFDQSEFAVVVETGWSPDEKPGTGAPVDLGPIDAYAPRVSLSEFRTEVLTQRRGDDTSTSMTTDMAGALGPGYWQGQVINDFTGTARINNLVWVTDRGPARLLIGQQRVGLNPLLPGFDLSGAQLALTNRPDLLYGQSPLGGQLVPSQLSPTSVIRGEGPPGGVAELRLGGQILSRTPITLDGQYEFRDIPAQPGDTARLEVVVYQFRDLGTPVRVDQVYSQASNLQLPEGVWVQFAGAGQNGRVLDADDPSRGSAGFYQARYGVNEHLTLDAIVQSVDGSRGGTVGAAMALGVLGSWAAYGAEDDDGRHAYHVLGDGQHGAYFWRADFTSADDDFFDGTGPRTQRYGEFGRMLGDRLRVSLVHGDYEDELQGHTRYTKPAADWRPIDSVSLSARPDFRGQYAYSAMWFPRPGTRVSANRFDRRTQLEVEQEIGANYRASGSVVDEPELGKRYAALLTRQALGPRRFTWTTGLLQGGGRAGYIVDAGAEVYPGLSVRAQALRDPLLARNGDNGTIVSLALVADFAVTPSGLARGSGFTRDLRPNGGISGVLAGDLPETFRRSALADINVNVDGQVRAVTDASGHFFVDGLAPGVYRVALDPDKLPIELHVEERALNVEVRAGAATRVDFPFTLLLGVAGRVQGKGDGTQVVLLGGDGGVVAHSPPNDFGFFRIDAVPPGQYRLQWRDGAGRVLAQREVSVKDNFVFGQDLSAAASSEGKTP